MITRYSIWPSNGSLVITESDTGWWYRWEDVREEIDNLKNQIDYLQKDNTRLFFLLNPKPEEDHANAKEM